MDSIFLPNNKKKALPRTKLAKVDPTFHKEMMNIAAKRLILGKDKRYSPPLVQKKILKHPLWPQIRKDLEISEFIKDETGQYDPFRILIFGIVAFLTIVFFAGLIYVTGLINNVFIDVGIKYDQSVSPNQSGYVNLSQAASSTFGVVNNSIQSLRMVAFVLIFAEIVLVFISAGLTRTYPAMFFVNVLIVFLAVMLSAPISNAYESLVNSGVYGGLLTSFTGANWIIQNLPVVTLLVGLLGGIFMFINIVRPGNEVTIG